MQKKIGRPFLANLPTYYVPFSSLNALPTHLPTPRYFFWDTYIENRPKINNSYQNQYFLMVRICLKLGFKIKSTYSKAGNFKINFANFLFFLFSSFYLVQKKWDVPSWPTYQPTMSLFSPSMLNLPTYPK